LKANTCQFCRFARPAEGLDAARRVCAQSEARTGSYKIVGCAETCDDWHLQPYRTFDPADVARDGTRMIPLGQGQFAIIDAPDYHKVSKYQWWVHKRRNNSYAATHHNGRYLYMHRLITSAPKGLFVDHIDHNGLNNTRKNLRICTAKQNRYNCRPNKGSTSKYKGVSWVPAHGKFRVRLAYERKHHYLGCFTDEKEAARAYDKKAKQLFGEFAYLNFPDENRRHSGC
jgi:hypothetical protein